MQRWLSPDPLMAMFADVSPYLFNDNNPINFTDPLGLTNRGSAKAGNQVKDKHKSSKPKKGQTKGGYTYNGSSWQTKEVVITASKSTAPTPTPPSAPDINANKVAEKANNYQNKLQNDLVYQLYNKVDKNSPQYKAFDAVDKFLEDINPIESTNIYGGVVIKTEFEAKGVKLVIPYGGFQTSYNTNSGLKSNFVGFDQFYVSGKLFGVDARIYPGKGYIGGDYTPGVRFLYGSSKDILGGLLVGKLQGDLQTDINMDNWSKSKVKIGGRTAVESLSIPWSTQISPQGIKYVPYFKFKNFSSSFKVEANFGINFELKIPNIFK